MSGYGPRLNSDGLTGGDKWVLIWEEARTVSQARHHHTGLENRRVERGD